MVNKEKNFVSAVIYVYNAENRIRIFLNAIIRIMENNFEHSEIICVNDSSDDHSADIIKEVSAIASSTSVFIVNTSYFHGLEISMSAGVDMSIGDFVFEFDNTYLDFTPGFVMDIYHHSLKGYDIVSASAKQREKFTSKIFYKIFDRYAPFPYKMSTESFRILSRRMVNRISSINKTVMYRKAIYASCGLKTDNIRYPVTTAFLPSSEKKEKRSRFNFAIDVLILFTEMGYSFAKLMTAFMMLMSVFMITYSIVIYATAEPVAGWTTTILFLSVAFFGLFGILTIIIKYLQLLLKMVFKKKYYSFESVEKLTG